MIELLGLALALAEQGAVRRGRQAAAQMAYIAAAIMVAAGCAAAAVACGLAADCRRRSSRGVCRRAGVDAVRGEAAGGPRCWRFA